MKQKHNTRLCRVFKICVENWKTQTHIHILYATKIFLFNFDVYSVFFLFLRTVKLYLRTLKGISELRVYGPD